MSTFFFILAGLCALAVVASLLLGVSSMAKGGETSKKYSNKLMQARVILQGATIVFFILAILSAQT